MVNMKIGGILLIAGAVLFLLSDTIFRDSEVTPYAMFLGLLMFLLGLILSLLAIIQVLIAKIKNRPK